MKLTAADKLVVVTDGVTEAENATGDFFGDEGLEQAAHSKTPFENVFEAVKSFCGETPLGDDCTILELTYVGH